MEITDEQLKLFKNRVEDARFHANQAASVISALENNLKELGKPPEKTESGETSDEDQS